MTYRLIMRRLRQMVRAHGQGFVMGGGKQVHFGVVDLTEQSPCTLSPTTGTAPCQLTSCVWQPMRRRGFEAENRGPQISSALRLLEGAADSAQAHVGPLPKVALPKADNVEA
jgi:hypothetical protein